MGLSYTPLLDKNMPENHVKPKLCKRKAVSCGDYVEIYEYERPYGYNFEAKNHHEGFKRALKRRSDHIERARKRMIRRIMANAINQKPVFITLTYDFVQLDREMVKKDLAKFVRKLRKFNKNVKYLYTFEKQQSGSIHVHMLVFNIVFIPIDLMLKWWKHANPANNSVDVSKIKKTENSKHVAFYLAKYVSKENMGSGNERLFSCSLNLLYPQEFRKVINMFDFVKGKQLAYSGGYFNPLGNFIRLKIYYLDKKYGK